MTELEQIREINAHLPFAHPIALTHPRPKTGKWFTRDIQHWRDLDLRERILRRFMRSER